MMGKVSDAEIDVLIYIARGYNKEQRKQRHWYSLGIKVIHRKNFSLEEQLDAIKELGRSNSKKALDYINKLLICESWKHEVDPASSSGDYGVGIYPNAGGKLKTVLDYDWGTGDSPYTRRYDRGQPDKKSLEIIEKAKINLEKSLNLTNEKVLK